MAITSRAILPNLHITTSVIVDGVFKPSAGTVTNAKFATDAGIARSKLAQDQLAKFPISPTGFRVWDDFNSLIGTAATDDLGITSTTYGTNGPVITAGDIMGATVTRYARALVAMPLEYDDAETVLIRIHAGMLTTIADTSCTVDVEIFESGKDGTNNNTDLVATAAKSINFLGFQDYDFTVTATDLVPGDILDMRLTVAGQDDNGVTAVTPTLGEVALVCDIKG